MSTQSTSLLGYGLYFIDVLACLLFCVTLALVSARFGHELTVPVDLPTLEPSAGVGSGVDTPTIALRHGDAGPELFLGDERLSFEALAARLSEAPPPAIVIRAEDSLLTRVIAAAHSAGVDGIDLAYEAEGGRDAE